MKVDTVRPVGASPALDVRSFAPLVTRAPEGHYVGDGTDAAVSYPDDGYDACFAVEDRSFWFQHRNRVIASLVDRVPPVGPLVDVGGGNGCVTKALQDGGVSAVLLEPAMAGIRNAAARGVRHRICGTVESVGLRDAGGVGVFDVVEHIDDDGAFLDSLRRAMRVGAPLYLTVPAFRFLWSTEDVAAGHFRRYRLRPLSDLVFAAGFDVRFASYLFAPLVAPILVRRTFGRHLSSSADHLHTGIAARALSRALDREARRVSRGGAIPLGSSCVIVAVRR